MVERQGLNLSARGKAARTEKGTGSSKQTKKPAPKREEPKESRARSLRRNSLEVDDEELEEDEEEDEELLGDLESEGGGKSKLLFYVAGVIVVVVVIVLFLLLGGKGKNRTPTVDPNAGVNNPPQSGVQSGVDQSQTPDPGPSSSVPNGLGTQDFTGNTNMNPGSVLTNPDEYVEDIYGLTTRVDYTVEKITSVADFVNYEKRRGTWGGGLELYWLDATYKNSKYVIQVPFQYYKELDEVGVVPVKMEVLTIAGSTSDQKLTVISYMVLDEKVLSDILKAQSK